jgi:hypothetical protein
MHAALATSVLAVVSALTPIGCASTSPGDGPWTTHYVGSSDDVWQAIHIALIDLGYRVDVEDRSEGTIRASRPDGEGVAPETVVTIDQVACGDQVNVYVRVAAADGDPELTPDQKQRLAGELLRPVNALLYRNPPER